MKRYRAKPAQQRCQLTFLGRDAMPKLAPDIRGTVVGESPSGRAWRVLWDESGYPVTLHKSFVQIIDEARAA